jgi:hypothetical protein
MIQVYVEGKDWPINIPCPDDPHGQDLLRLMKPLGAQYDAKTVIYTATTTCNKLNFIVMCRTGVISPSTPLDRLLRIGLGEPGSVSV